MEIGLIPWSQYSPDKMYKLTLILVTVFIISNLKSIIQFLPKCSNLVFIRWLMYLCGLFGCLLFHILFSFFIDLW